MDINEKKHDINTQNHAKYDKFSRRSFLKGALAAGTALALAGCGETETVTNTVTNTVTVTEKVTQTVTNTVTVTEKELGTMPAAKHIKLIEEYCCGCQTCEMICSTRHFGEASRYLSAIRLQADFFEHRFYYYGCAQCDSASCVSACTVDAIKFDSATGARYIDTDACILCGKCVEACPFADEKYPPIYLSTCDDENVLVKCDLCHGFADGPACVANCPKTALVLE